MKLTSKNSSKKAKATRAQMAKVIVRKKTEEDRISEFLESQGLRSMSKKTRRRLEKAGALGMPRE